ncbi:hypothetical protein TB2_025293 [Malus domestica]
MKWTIYRVKMPRPNPNTSPTLHPNPLPIIPQSRHFSLSISTPREKPQPVKGFEFHVKRRRIGARSWAALLAKEILFTEAASGFDLQLIMPDQTLAEGGRNQRARTSFVGSEGSDGVGVVERITDSSKEELVVVEEIFTPQIQGKRDPKTP